MRKQDARGGEHGEGTLGPSFAAFCMIPANSSQKYLSGVGYAEEGVGLMGNQRRMPHEGRYVLSENHVVRKLDTCLAPADGEKFDEAEMFRMTDYALEHMDECCLVIKKLGVKEPWGGEN